MERLFRLEGEAFDLDDLVDLFHAGGVKIIFHDEAHYLSMEMPTELDDEVALTIAEDKLATITGLALVRIGNHHRARIAGVSTFP